MDDRLMFWLPLGTVGGLGLLGNTMVFIVLRLESNKLPVIYWLMCLAIADFGCLVFWPMTAVSRTCAYRVERCSETQFRLFQASELIQDIFLSVAGFFILGASIDRYIAIALPRSSRKWSTKKNALIAIGTIVIFALGVHFICFMLHDRQPVGPDTGNQTPETIPSQSPAHLSESPADYTTKTFVDLSTIDAQIGAVDGSRVEVMHIISFILMQIVPLALLAVFFVLLSVTLTRANRQLSRQRYTRKYLANVSNTTVVIVIQVMFLVCSGYAVVYNLLFIILNIEVVKSTNEAMFIAKVILICIRVSATFFIFLAIDMKFRSNARDFLACKGVQSRSRDQDA